MGPIRARETCSNGFGERGRRTDGPNRNDFVEVRVGDVLDETDLPAALTEGHSERYCSNLSMNHLSTRTQISSLPTWSSMPCSRLGLSLTSMTMKPRSVSLTSTP